MADLGGGHFLEFSRRTSELTLPLSAHMSKSLDRSEQVGTAWERHKYAR